MKTEDILQLFKEFELAVDDVVANYADLIDNKCECDLTNKL